MRKYQTLWVFTLGSALLFLSAQGAAQSSSFVSIDVPCSTCANGIANQTAANGVNDYGDIVGNYTDALGQHGFLLSGGQFTSLDFPGAVATNARGISWDGEIVGNYVARVGSSPDCTVLASNVVSAACTKGFLYNRGAFSTVLFPLHPGSILQRITTGGVIYGCYHDTDLMGSMYGAASTRRGYISLAKGEGELADPAQSVPDSMNNGATDDGHTIVGMYTYPATSTGVTHGYIVQNGNFQSYDVAGSTFTQIWDINPGQEFVGTYVDNLGKKHGFLQLPDGSTPIKLDYPGAAATIAFGINPGGAIVGQYTDTQKHAHGFLAVLDYSRRSR